VSTGLALIVFVGSLALSVVSSSVLADLLDKIGNRYRLSEGLVGIITALGADSPEIAAAVTAIAAGSNDLGVGVVLGSNLYNVAALLGLSSVIAGVIRIRRRALLLQGGVAVVVTAVGVALVLHVLGPVTSLVVVLAVLAPYVTLSSLRGPVLRARLPAGRARRFLLAALVDQERDVRSGKTPPRATRNDQLAVIPVLTSVVVASIGLVNSAEDLGTRFGISDVVVGTLVLAVLTGIPNVLASIRLARRGRGSAVVSEALNSNSINVVVGLCLPAVLVGLGGRTHTAALEATWLLGTTVLAAVLMFFRGGLLRWEGIGVIAAYLAFVAVLLLTT
jgi:cation:H+ antiporter